MRRTVPGPDFSKGSLGWGPGLSLFGPGYESRFISVSPAEPGHRSRSAVGLLSGPCPSALVSAQSCLVHPCSITSEAPLGCCSLERAGTICTISCVRGPTPAVASQGVAAAVWTWHACVSIGRAARTSGVPLLSNSSVNFFFVYRMLFWMVRGATFFASLWVFHSCWRNGSGC